MYPLPHFRKTIKIIFNIQFCSWFWRFATIYRQSRSQSMPVRGLYTLGTRLIYR
jgi:hypothetical protein